MSLKAGRVGVNPADVDPIDGHINGNISAYTKDEADVKFATLNQVNALPTYNAVSDLIDGTVGWVGKNKFNIKLSDIKQYNTTGTWSGNAYTISGVTITFNTDGEYVSSIKVNGTLSVAEQIINIARKEIGWKPDNGNYLLSKGESTSDFGFTLEAYNGSTWVKVLCSNFLQEPVPVDIDYSGYDRVNITLTLKNTRTYSNLIIYPMLSDASITDSTYEPYHKSVEDIVDPIQAYTVKLNTELLAASSFNDFKTRMSS